MLTAPERWVKPMQPVPVIFPILMAMCGIAGGLRAQSAAPRVPSSAARIPILEYHLIGDRDSRWGRSRDGFRRDLQLLYDRGYRPITVAELVDGSFTLPAGRSPVVFTFDDASPGQFRYVEKDGELAVDPASGLGIWLDFAKTHPDWTPRGTFCMLPAASHGHAFFGDKGIQGQRTEWRFPKLRDLAARGFELCVHTLWHANLGKLSDTEVQEQIARSVLAVDSAVPGYRVRTFALPLGIWPKNRALARAGSWHDPKTGRVVRYAFDAVLEVAGGPAPSRGAPEFDPGSLPRVQVIGDNLARELDRIERTRYVSAGRGRERAAEGGN